MTRLRHALLALLSAIAALLALPAWAREPAPRPDPVAAIKAPAMVSVARPALWKVADEDTTIWIFGTVHVLPEGIHWLDGTVAKALRGSDSLVTEIVEGDAEKMQGLVLQKAILPEGKTLRELLSDAERKQFEAALGDLQVPVSMFDRFDPWYAAVGISTLPLLKEGYNQANGVEQILGNHAKARAMPHGALETAEYQLTLFDSLPIEVQRRYLGEVLTQLPKLKGELRAMIEAWQRGEIERLAEIMNAETSDPMLTKVLLTDRNAAWAKWVDDRLDRPGTVFLAVGAGHLAGKGSLQDMLAERKITSQRVQ